MCVIIYIIILDPDDQRMTTMHSNDTLVDTPFQLISGFFHVNQGVLCCEHAEQASSGGGGATGLVNKGGGSSRLPGLVTKQQAVEFPHAGTDYSKELIIIATINLLCCICSY